MSLSQACVCHRPNFLHNPKSNGRTPLALCQWSQWDANFWVGLQKYINPAADMLWILYREPKFLGFYLIIDSVYFVVDCNAEALLRCLRMWKLKSCKRESILVCNKMFPMKKDIHKNRTHV